MKSYILMLCSLSIFFILGISRTLKNEVQSISIPKTLGIVNPKEVECKNNQGNYLSHNICYKTCDQKNVNGSLVFMGKRDKIKFREFYSYDNKKWNECLPVVSSIHRKCENTIKDQKTGKAITYQGYQATRDIGKTWSNCQGGV